MQIENIREIVPTQRLEQLIGSGDPSSAEIHDMAVELILRRRPAIGEGSRVEVVKAARELLAETDPYREGRGADAEITARRNLVAALNAFDSSALRSPPEPVSVVEDEERWRLFPKKTPEEVDRDPVHQEVSRQLKPLRDAFFPPEPGRDAPDPVGYCVWINGKLAGCAKNHRGAFPVFASAPDGELVRMREQEQADFERGQALLVKWITRPLIGIENRTAQEVFDIMADRVRAALSAKEA